MNIGLKLQELESDLEEVAFADISRYELRLLCDGLLNILDPQCD